MGEELGQGKEQFIQLDRSILDGFIFFFFFFKLAFYEYYTEQNYRLDTSYGLHPAREYRGPNMVNDPI